MLLTRLFDRLIATGRLRLVDARGAAHVFEGAPGPQAAIRLHDPALHWKLIWSSESPIYGGSGTRPFSAEGRRLLPAESAYLLHPAT